MANNKNQCIEKNCLEKGFSIFERNNYFCGKLMVDRDFLADQLYHMGKQRLHSSFLHGWGTVCGLKVDPHPHCPNLRVVVHPGLAVDCWGREIFVPNQCEVELESYKKNGSKGKKPENLYICLRYQECETEPVPIFLDECGCSETCEYNRIRETFAIDVLTGDDFEESELDGYKGDRIVSAWEVDIDTSTKIDEFLDTVITIKTLKGSYSETLNAVHFSTVQDMLDGINGSNLDLSFEYIAEKSRYVLTAKTPGNVIILEEICPDLNKSFFSRIGFPAIQILHGFKIIESCPGCSDLNRIILAEIRRYNNVDHRNYLDPTHEDFKIPAYEVDNFSYRKTLPSAELLNKLMIYHTFKKQKGKK